MNFKVLTVFEDVTDEPEVGSHNLMTDESDGESGCRQKQTLIETKFLKQNSIFKCCFFAHIWMSLELFK